MTYKLVAVDVDGTLINENHVIPPENIKTIRTLREKGILFVIVTGRHDFMVREYIKTLNITAPVIGCNGATTRDIINDKLYALHTIPNESLLEIYKYLAGNKHIGKLFDMNTLYMDNKDDYTRYKDTDFEFMEMVKEYMGIKTFDNIEELISKDVKPTKLVFVNENPQIIIDLQKDIKKISGIEVFRSARTCLDIVAKNVSKGNALKDYTESIGIDASEIIAIGDSENDYSMIKFAGFGITLENGEDCLKEIADMVTDTNYNAGLSKALNKIFNLC